MKITSGIVCDNYKVDKFKKELEKEKFNDYEIFQNKGGSLSQTTTIRVKMDSSDIIRMKKLCQKVELHFKTSN